MPVLKRVEWLVRPVRKRRPDEFLDERTQLEGRRGVKKSRTSERRYKCFGGSVKPNQPATCSPSGAYFRWFSG